MVASWVENLGALGNWGEAGQTLAPIAGALGAGQGLYTALTAGPNKRDGLVADAASSVAMGGVSMGLSAAPKVAQYFASEAGKAAVANPADMAGWVNYNDAVGRADYLKEKAAQSATPIIDVALITHAALSYCNGANAPNSGGNLGTAAKDLDLAEQHLVQAGQTTGWTGAGQETYSGANNAQKTRANKLATIDRDFETALKKQATQVLDLREKFGYIKTAMNTAKAAAIVLNNLGPYGQAASVALQTTTAAACLLADASHQGMQHQEALKNADEFVSLAGRYQAV
jgi:hypothetical protein